MSHGCSKYIFQNSPLLRYDMTPSYFQNQSPNQVYSPNQVFSPGSQFGIADQGDNNEFINSPFLGIKNKLEYDTPLKGQLHNV